MDFQSKRIVNIIHFLANKNAHLKVSDIAEMNDCSEKTVYNDIKFIQNSWNDLLNIERYNNVFVANIKSQSHVKYIYSQILSNSNSIKILVAIFMKPDQSIHYYATKTNTSITNLYNSIKTINEKLEPFELQIMNKNRTFRVTGKNYDHYLLFYTMIFLESEIQEQYDCVETISVIEKRLKKVFIDPYEEIALLNFFSTYYYVALLSLKHDKKIYKKHKINQNKLIDKDENFYLELKNLCPTIQELGFNFIESKIEKTCRIKETKNLDEEQKIKEFLIDQLTGKTLLLDNERLEKMVKIITVVVYGFNLEEGEIPHFTNRFQSFSARIQTRSPETHEFLENMFDQMAKEFNFNFNHCTHYLIYWMTLTFHDFHYVRKKKILVVSDHNQIHADYLKNHIQRQLGSYEYQSIYLKDCKSWDDTLNENDFFRIISTHTLKKIPEEKLIIIGDYIALDDLAAIFYHISGENFAWKISDPF